MVASGAVGAAARRDGARSGGWDVVTVVAGTGAGEGGAVVGGEELGARGKEAVS